MTIAGVGEAGREGDGGPAASAQVGGPFGVCVGPDNAVYVCETTSHVIRRIDEASGRISTIAGCGRAGYDGDGGLATEARLNEPYEVRFDQAGNMFFVEMKNHIVRRVDRGSGRISTIAGTGRRGFSGDGGPATRAELNRPHSIALDEHGNVYICDIGNHRVRRVDARSGKIETFAGTGTRQPTPDGVMHYPFNDTTREGWQANPSIRNAYRTLVPLAANSAWSYRNDPAAAALLSSRNSE